MAQREIFAHELDRVCTLVNKKRAFCPTRERLDAELPRARKKIEHARILHVELDTIKNTFLDLVGRRAGLHALELAQPPSARRACDDSHVYPSAAPKAGAMNSLVSIIREFPFIFNRVLDIFPHFTQNIFSCYSAPLRI